MRPRPENQPDHPSHNPPGEPTDTRCDDLQSLNADLRRWIEQNSNGDDEFFLDEGPLADPVASTVIPAQPSTDPAPAPVAEPQPAEDGFAVACRAFVDETLKQIVREKKIQLPVTRSDRLLEETGGDQTAALDLLRQEVLPCTACALGQTRTNTVFGSGSATADVVFVGEAPGRDEDLQGEPFVGRSGQLLTKILGAIDLSRQDVYICNILKCRPPNNRDPQPDEVAVCEPHLKRQLTIIQPRVICCLGRVAAQTLLGTKASLRTLRETVHFYEGIPVMATYHPAALLRNPNWKRDTWNDVRKLKALYETLGEDR